MASFDQFLIANYPDEENQILRTRAFLEQLDTNFAMDSSWIFQTEQNQQIVNAFETSGLRKEFAIYHYEEDDYTPYDVKSLLPLPPLRDTSRGDLGEIEAIIDEEIDPLPPDSAEMDRLAIREAEREEQYQNMLVPNENGKFIYGLAKYGRKDSIVSFFVDLYAFWMPPSLTLFIPHLLYYPYTDFTNPFVRRILVTEIYYWFMLEDVRRNSQK